MLRNPAAARQARPRSTASRVATGTITYGTPHDTCSHGQARRRGCRLRARPARPRRGRHHRTSGRTRACCCVIHAKLNRSPSIRATTGVGPMFNPNDQSGVPGAIAPSRASANVLPIDRVARHRHLRARRKDSHAHVGARHARPRHERRLGEADLPGDLLHRLRRQTGCFRETPQAGCRRSAGP